VAVPQAYAGDVAVGKEVSIKLIERPNAGFKGKVSRVAGGVDTATRSVQVEVEVPNPEGKLLPGAYVEATLPLSGNKGAMLLAPTALQFRQDGPRVATVVGDRVEFKQIKVGRDLGRAVEVTAGLSPKDVVVLNPYDTLENGEKVLTKEAPPEKEPTKDAAKGGASAPQNNTKPERPSAKG
jgi:multidrug efflux system membrane fusion protein